MYRVSKQMQAVIPAHAGIQKQEVIPAHAGIQMQAVIPAHAGIQKQAVIPAHAGIQKQAVIPAHAGIQMHHSGACRNPVDEVSFHYNEFSIDWIPACAGMTGRRHAPE